MKNNRSLFFYVWTFIKEEKKWWLTPIILAFVIFAVLLVITHNAPLVAPFVYTIF
jgi:hypothetical protein